MNELPEHISHDAQLSNNTTKKNVALSKSATGSNRKRITKEVPRYPCLNCGKKFTRSGTLKDHERAHDGARPFKCSSCDKSFTRLRDKERHQNLHAAQKRFVCRGSFGSKIWGCGRKFAREDGLVAHFRSVTGTECMRNIQEWSLFWIKAIAAERLVRLPSMTSSVGQCKIVASVDEALHSIDCSEADFTVLRARCSAQEFREEEEQKEKKQKSIPYDPEIFDDIGVAEFSPSQGGEGSLLLARVGHSSFWKSWMLHDIIFGDSTTKNFSWSPNFLPSSRGEYIIILKVPQKSTPKGVSESVSLKLRVKHRRFWSLPPRIFNFGTFTYGISPEEKNLPNEQPPASSMADQTNATEYDSLSSSSSSSSSPSTIASADAPTLIPIEGPTILAFQGYSQARQELPHKQDWPWQYSMRQCL